LQSNWTPQPWDGKERVNILLLGNDVRGLRPDALPRSDMMLVLSLDPQTKQASMMSILRDTYVDIPDHRSNRINVAMSLGGPELAMRTASELLGIPIQFYVSTDFEGFISLVDTLGGIELYVEKDMTYVDSADDHVYDIRLKQGYQKLDGKKSLQYVRFRHDAMSDFTRTERQRKFISSLVSKLKSSTSLFKLPSILQAIEPHIQTNMSLSNMSKLAVTAYDFDLSTVRGMQVPPTELVVGRKINGASVLTVDPSQLKPAVQQFLENTSEPTETVSDTNDASANSSSPGSSPAGTTP
jgi:LCP family protein required for cell wall assembly